MQKFHLIVTCASGIEGIVGNELRNMGYQPQVENGRARITGDIKDIARMSLWLRTADRIKIVVGEFKATTFDELFEKTKALDWDSYLPMDAKFPMEGRCTKSKLHSVPDVQSIAKKAVVNKLSSVYHRRNWLPETGELFPLEVSINKDKVMLTLDTTGPSLFKRGYRRLKGSAPLKENMAAALLLLTNWQPDKMPLVDPMCGSGTIPIEATLLGKNIAPGFNRDFTFETWNWVDDNLVQSVRDEAEGMANYDAPLEIFASDVDSEMINATKTNAQEVGLLQDIHYKQLAVQDFHTTMKNGIVVSNPPYGERMGDQNKVRNLYRQLGQVFRPMSDWSKYFLSSDLSFEKYYGNRATKKRKLYNGTLRTDYYQFWAQRH